MPDQTRFSVDRADGWTECACITDPCQHGDERMRPYAAWTVWDNDRDDHAYCTVKDFGFDVEYLHKRDAKAALERYLAQRGTDT